MMLLLWTIQIFIRKCKRKLGEKISRSSISSISPVKSIMLGFRILLAQGF